MLKQILIPMLLIASVAQAEDGPAFDDSSWKRDGFVQPRYWVEGTGGRNNPLRRKLKSVFSGDELFVRYRLRYDAESIDQPSGATDQQSSGNGEFFVLWLDSVEGGPGNTHSNGIANLGVHISNNTNRLMARFSANREVYGPELIGDQEYLLVGRVWKSTPGVDAPFNRLDFWVNPEPSTANQPTATAMHSKGVPTISWVGVSTGTKTEPSDRIEVWDFAVGDTWESVLDLPPKVITPDVVDVPKTVSFQHDVFPVLRERCFRCHAGSDAKE